MSATHNPSNFLSVQDLPRKPASEVRTAGWPETVRVAQEAGALLVTNHDRPEAVIMAVREYERLLDVFRQSEDQIEMTLDELRREYDKRLSVLRSHSAAERLRASIRKPAKVAGKIKAGRTY